MEDKKQDNRPGGIPGMSFNAPVTFNAPMFDIHDNTNVYINASPDEQGGSRTPAPTSASSPVGDTKVFEALGALLEATDEQGRPIFTEKGQWYAVYRVLSEQMGYPKEMRDFCNAMTGMGMDKVCPAISYESIKKIPQNVHLPSSKVTLWSTYLARADEKMRKQIVVAMELMKRLESDYSG